MSQLDHDRLREELHDLAPTSRTPASPLPGVHGRIRAIRRRRALTAGAVAVACAGLLAAAIVPALQNGTGTSVAPAGQANGPDQSTKPSPTRTVGASGRPSPASGVTVVGLPVGTQAVGPGFEEFVEGKQGPGYVVLANGGTTVVSHRENGTGRPCLSVAGEGADRWPAIRFCADEGALDGQVTWQTFRSEDGRWALLVAIAPAATHDVEPILAGGESLARYDAVATATTSGVRFAAVELESEVTIEKVAGHRSADEAAQGTEPPAGKGKSTTTRAAGPGMEEYVDGKQGPGYTWNEGAEGGWAVSHELNGSGAPCLTFEPAFDNARVCFDGFGEGERISWVAKPRPGGGELIAGFAKLDVGTVELFDVNGDSMIGISAVATPTSDEVAFFEFVTNKGAAKVGRIVAD
jgi:hypothetical protein